MYCAVTKTLKSLSMFSGTLVHELVHAKTGLPDVNREFESVLTDEIGNAYHLLLINKKAMKLMTII